jgi:hypothetical protein
LSSLGERAFHNPSPGQYGEGVSFAALGDFHACPQSFLGGPGKGSPVAAINQNLPDAATAMKAPDKGFPRAIPV